MLFTMIPFLFSNHWPEKSYQWSKTKKNAQMSHMYTKYKHLCLGTTFSDSLAMCHEEKKIALGNKLF